MKIKEKFKLAAVLSGLLFNSASFAGLVVIDDFSIPQGPVADITADGVGVTSIIPGVRTITHKLIATELPTNSQTEVVIGRLDISNGTQEDSLVTLSWLLSPNLFPAGVTDLKYKFEIIKTDPNQTNLKFTIDGENLASFDLPGSLTKAPFSFAMDEQGVNRINLGGNLQLAINGSDAWDLAVDMFGFNYTTPIMPSIKPLLDPVPEPTTLAILSLALMGAGYVQRKKNL